MLLKNQHMNGLLHLMPSAGINILQEQEISLFLAHLFQRVLSHIHVTIAQFGAKRNLQQDRYKPHLSKEATSDDQRYAKTNCDFSSQCNNQSSFNDLILCFHCRLGGKKKFEGSNSHFHPVINGNHSFHLRQYI